jgi:hypothetical protein
MMKVKAIFLAVSLGWASLTACFGQAPPNDNFTNATVLTGNNILFTGNLTGSTGEPYEADGEPFIIPLAYVQHSVWWSWTAPQSGPVTIVALSYSQDTFDQENYYCNTYLAVYSTTNVSPHNTAAISSTWLEAAFNKLSITFMASAGTSYQIQFADEDFKNSTLQANFQLIATNTPVIFDQPADQTILPGGSALFTILADGIRPLSYQWCSNGVAIPGATYPMLPMDNVTVDQAGAYAVIVSNATGVVTSQVANLTVTTNLPSPSLAALGQATNGFAFSLVGDSGRYWRIESSTDLVNWQPERNFPSTQVTLVTTNTPTIYTSVAFTTNSMISLVVPANGAAKFVRAHNYIAPNEICNNNLKRIRFAKQLWARASYYTGDTKIIELPVGRIETPAGVELDVYGLNSAILSCPVEGGTYLYNFSTALALPTCPVPSHILEEPR